jgi:hypothetical protein
MLVLSAQLHTSAVVCTCHVDVTSSSCAGCGGARDAAIASMRHAQVARVY